MVLLDRTAFLALKHDLPREEVTLPAGSVFVRVLTAAERDKLEAAHNAQRDRHARFRARFVAAVACDSEGRPLFTEADIPALDEVPATALDPIVKAGMRLNGMGDEATRDVEKNS